MRPQTMQTIILDPPVSSESIDFDNQFGTYIGFFGFRTTGDIFFFLGTKVNSESHITYAYVFYLNEDFTSIQESELRTLKQSLPNIEQKHRCGFVGVVNVKCLLHPSLHLSMFLEAIDSILDLDLINRFERIRFVETEMLNLSIGPIQSCRLSHCEGTPSTDVLESFKDIAMELRLSFCYCPDGRIINRSDTLLLRTNGHLIGIILNRQSNYVNHILLHRNQYNSEKHYADVVRHINEVYRNKTFSHFCTRICPSTFVTCYGEETLRAWKLCLRMQPNVLSVVRDDELDYSFGSGRLDLMRIRRYQTGCILKPYNTATQSQPSSRSQVNITLKSTGDVTRVLHQFDSQSTAIMDPRDWRTNLATWNDLNRECRRIRDSIIPPIHIMEPTNDLDRRYLIDLPSFRDALELMKTIWDRYAPTTMCYSLSSDPNTHDKARRGARFIIYAVDNIYTNEVVLVVADQVTKQWILMNANNTEHRDNLQFEMMANLIGRFTELDGFVGEAIGISSQFHQEYPKLHLIMSLYVISRLFRYCIGLPKRIVYGEQEFRLYGNSISASLQVANNTYNSENDLIDDTGRLKRGAKRSLVSPIRYVTGSVVPKDLCMFCKQRGFNNLGRHYAAKHGQQAKYANKIRSEKRAANQ